MYCGPLLAFLLLFLALPARSQTAIERYVIEGLAASPRTHMALEARALAQAEARESGYGYLPSLDLQARYTRAGGGRTIDFPLGDLLNPAYGALNDLTGSSAFPTLENESFRLLREREQETKLQLYQPLYEPALGPAADASRAVAEAAGAEFDKVRLDVAASIRTAFLSVVMAKAALEIQAQALEQVQETHRATERLVDSGSATPDALYRVEAVLAETLQAVESARIDLELARAAFNNEINRPLDEPIEMMGIDDLERTLGAGRKSRSVSPDEDDAALGAWALRERPELRRLAQFETAAAAAVKAQRRTLQPSIGVALDLGIQGSAYELDGGARFQSASIVVRWNLFDGFRRQSRIEQAQLDGRRISAQRANVARLIALEVRQAERTAELARRNIAVAQDRLRSAQSAQRLVARRYEEGMATLLDVLDARTSLTAAEQGLLLVRVDALKREVALIRAAALEPTF